MKFSLLIALSVLVSLSGTLAQTADSTRVRSAPTATYQMNQQEIQQALNMVATPDATLRNVRIFDARYEGVRGTPYFLPKWNEGQIEMASGQQFTNVSLKFDAYQQQLILLRPRMGNDSIIINADQVKSFQLSNTDGQAYLFRRYPTAKTGDEALKTGYFIVLYQGKSALLKRFAKTLKQADYKNPYSTDVRYDQFVNATSYYLLKPDQTLTKVKLSDKSIIDALDNHQEDLKAFAKQTKLSGKTEDEAIQLVKQYDTL